MLNGTQFTRKLIPFGLFSIVLLAIGGWWISLDSNRQSPPAPPLANSTQNLEPSNDAEPSGEAVEPLESHSISTAKSIVHVPKGNPDASDSEALSGLNITPENLYELTRQNLDSAISGDLDAVSGILLARKHCRKAPKNQAELETALNKLAGIKQLFLEIQPNTAFPMEENRAAEMSRYENCRQLSGLFNNELRRKLDNLAQQGNVVARYLYATWPPDDFKDAASFIVLQDWRIKATEYSTLNLEEGESLGLLAFADSYVNGHLFTPSDHYLGTALYVEAADCGFVHQDGQRLMNTFLYIENQPEQELTLQNAAMAKAEKLGMYCK